MTSVNAGTLYMLDTNICSFYMRHRPEIVTERLERAVSSGASVVISAVVYSELKDGVFAANASSALPALLDEFLQRLDGVLPWDRAAADATALIRQSLNSAGMPISPNDSAIAGHAMALGATVVTNNTREFDRVPGLLVEDWTNPQILPADRMSEEVYES